MPFYTNLLVIYAPSQMAPKFCGVRQKGNKYYATIRKDTVVHEVGHWDTPELAAHAYDAMAVSSFRKGRI